jgi:hypothetical protein
MKEIFIRSRKAGCCAAGYAGFIGHLAGLWSIRPNPFDEHNTTCDDSEDNDNDD